MSVDTALDGSTGGKSSTNWETENRHFISTLTESAPGEPYPPVLITPTADNTSAVQRETPDSPPSSPPEAAPDDVSDDGALLLYRRDAEQSAQALENLSEGIRAVKRILERCASDENDTQEYCTKDIQQVHRLASRLYGVLGSDLMALINAADMIREHSKLAFLETSEVVTDLTRAKLQAEESALQAKQARKVGRQLLEENLLLKDEIDRLRREKRLLVKEVKTLREEAAETRKFDSWRLLEQHILGSMAIHEMVLKTPTTPRLNVFKENGSFGGETTPNDVEKEKLEDRLDPEHTQGSGSCTAGSAFGGRLVGFRAAFRNRTIPSPANDTTNGEEHEQEASKEDKPSDEADDPTKIALGLSSRLKTKSPIPSLGEVSSFTDDSSATKTPKNARTSMESHIDNGTKNFSATFFPANVAFGNSAVSPLLTPNEYPDTADHKPSCDPNILRTLAIPSTEQPSVGYKDASPHESLYEC